MIPIDCEKRLGSSFLTLLLECSILYSHHSKCLLVNNKMVNIIDPHYFRNGQCLGGAGAIREL